MSKKLIGSMMVMMWVGLQLVWVSTGEVAQVPEEYRETYQAIEKTLDEFERHLDQRWDGKKYNVAFGANLLPVNLHVGEEMISGGQYYRQTLAYLDALHSLGVKEIHIDVGYPLFSTDNPRWRDFLAFYQDLISEIKRRGLKLHVEIAFAEPAEKSSGWLKVSYKGFTKAKVKEELLRHALISAEYLQPDYLSLADEPTTLNSRFGLDLTIEEWTKIISEIASELKAKHPKIRVGAGGGTWEANFLKSFIENTPIDYLDLHIYGLNNFKRGDLYVALQIIQHAKRNGKGVGLGEVWLHFGGRKQKGRYSNAFSFWSPLDARFLRIIVKLAHWQKLEFVDPFFTMYFFTYLNYDEVMKNPKRYQPPRKGLKIILQRAMRDAGQRKFTETGLAYKEALAGLHKGASGERRNFSRIRGAVVYELVIGRKEKQNLHLGVFRY